MTSKNDWNYERYRTRDRLLEYDNAIVPPRPHTAGLNIIYPWENLALSMFMKQLFTIAEKSGFTGTEEEFKEHFGTYLHNKQVIYANYIDFPIVGEETKLYFDLEEKILYYWNNAYIPINATLITNTIVTGSEA